MLRHHRPGQLRCGAATEPAVLMLPTGPQLGQSHRAATLRVPQPESLLQRGLRGQGAQYGAQRRLDCDRLRDTLLLPGGLYEIWLQSFF